jgi:hypothetical protein
VDPAYLNGDLNVLTSPFGPDLVIQLGILPVGVIVATRESRNPIGWLFLGASLLGSLHAASGEYALRGLLGAPGLPGAQWAAWLSSWIIDLVFPAGALLFVLLLFPTGRLAGPRWRLLAGAAVLFTPSCCSRRSRTTRRSRLHRMSRLSPTRPP